MQTTNKNSVQRRHHATILPATRITHAFERAQNEERGILIPYFMCGYPSAAQSIELVLAAATGGADIIELGMPFSDPLADGATIQHAGHVALERGMTVNGCLEIARRVASQCAVPLLFMGYYNPILAYGLERFCQMLPGCDCLGRGSTLPYYVLEVRVMPQPTAGQIHGIVVT